MSDIQVIGVASKRRPAEAQAEHDKPRRKRTPRPAPLPDAIAYTVADACRIAGIGRTKLYELIGANRLKVSRAAGRVLVLGDSLRALLTADAA